MTAAPLALGELLPLTRRLGATADPLGLYAGLSDNGRRAHTLLLESADAATGAGERSLLVVRSALRVQCLGRSVLVEALSANGQAMLPWLQARFQDRAVRQGDSLTIEFPAITNNLLDEASRALAPSPFDVLRALAWGLKISERPSDINHLIAGIFGYDLIDLFEPLPIPIDGDPEFPRYDFWLPDRMIVLDHLRRSTTVVALAAGGEGYQARYNDAVSAVAELSRLAASGPLGSLDEGPDPVAKPQVTSDLDDAAYAALVGRIKRHITNGDVFQIVPSRTFRIPCPNPLNSYRGLRTSNPSPYMFYVVAPDYTLFGASPETCVKVSGNPATVLIRPIAGTVPRGRQPDGRPDPDLDARLEVALRTDTKEVAEHLMLVDLARNDVARVSKPGSRELVKLLIVERYSHVMHLVSEVTGELLPGLDALHAYAASMNMGTLVGAPKVRAAQLLREFESSARGPYGGAVGYLTETGELDTAIIIRSALVRQELAEIRAGAGIVYDSDPATEARETRHKAAAVLRAIAGGEVL